MPGDSLKASQQSLYFHRDQMYKISKIFIHNKIPLIIVLDKYGKEVPLHLFKFDNNLYETLQKRKLAARLQFFWKNNIELITWSPGHTYDFNRIDFYKISRAHFLDNPDAIASITKYKLDINNPNGSGYKYHYDDSVNYYIKKEQDFYDFWAKFQKDNNLDTNAMLYRLHLPHTQIHTQDEIDKIFFIKEQCYESFDLNKIDTYDNYDLNTVYNHSNDSWNNYQKFLSLYIFDKTELSINEKEIINDILTLIYELPSSHSSTSIAKILNGNTKYNNVKTNQFIGKYKGKLKYQQLFELADAILIYLQHKKILTEKESYSSSDEWRGQFEYIGNKIKDKKGIQELQNKIS